MKKKPTPAPDHVLAGWLTIAEAAERMGMKPDTLRQHCYRRTCPCRRIGRAILIHQDELDEWNATRRRVGNPSVVYQLQFSTEYQPEDGWDAAASQQWKRIEIAAARYGVTIHSPPMYWQGREIYAAEGARARAFCRWLGKLTPEAMGLRIEKHPDSA